MTKILRKLRTEENFLNLVMKMIKIKPYFNIILMVKFYITSH